MGKAETVISKILILMDATGSMGSLIDRTKQTIATMFDQAYQVLKDNNIPTDSF